MYLLQLGDVMIPIKTISTLLDLEDQAYEANRVVRRYGETIHIVNAKMIYGQVNIMLRQAGLLPRQNMTTTTAEPI
jgi:hypothetical protein